MRYFFIPGRSKGLSHVELEKVLKSFEIENYNLSIREDFFLLDTKEEQGSIHKVFNQLGGFLSFGIIYDDIDKVLSDFIATRKDQKVVFGLSIYSDDPSKYSKKKAKDVLEYIKEVFSSNDISSRYLIPNGLQLDTGQILRGKILTKGFELVILESKGKLFYGKTVDIQDIELYSEIEYDKPYTNTEMGVLPAKLAKIMINLTGLPVGSTIWDPFCGSGTTLLMGLLSGMNMLGSDIDENAVEGAIKNIEWISSSPAVRNSKYEVFKFDVTDADLKTILTLKRTEIEGIVCEPFMGPPQFKPLSPSAAKKLLANVENMYKSLFSLIDEMKKRTSTIVLIVPSYKTYGGWVTLSLNSILPKRWTIERVDEEGDLHWRRSNSIIKRNIFIIKSKSS